MVNQLDTSVSNFRVSRKLVLILLVLLLCFPGVMAQNITFAEPDTLIHKDVVVYGVNSTTGIFEQLAVYNTTTAGIYLSNSSYPDMMFVFKPQYTSPLDNPSAWLSNAMSWMSTNVVELAVAFTLIGFILTRR